MSVMVDCSTPSIKYKLLLLLFFFLFVYFTCAESQLHNLKLPRGASPSWFQHGRTRVTGPKVPGVTTATSANSAATSRLSRRVAEGVKVDVIKAMKIVCDAVALIEEDLAVIDVQLGIMRQEQQLDAMEEESEEAVVAEGVEMVASAEDGETSVAVQLTSERSEFMEKSKRNSADLRTHAEGSGVSASGCEYSAGAKEGAVAVDSDVSDVVRVDPVKAESEDTVALNGTQPQETTLHIEKMVVDEFAPVVEVDAPITEPCGAGARAALRRDTVAVEGDAQQLVFSALQVEDAQAATQRYKAGLLSPWALAFNESVATELHKSSEHGDADSEYIHGVRSAMQADAALSQDAPNGKLQPKVVWSVCNKHEAIVGAQTQREVPHPQPPQIETGRDSAASGMAVVHVRRLVKELQSTTGGHIGQSNRTWTSLTCPAHVDGTADIDICARETLNMCPATANGHLHGNITNTNYTDDIVPLWTEALSALTATATGQWVVIVQSISDHGPTFMGSTLAMMVSVNGAFLKMVVMDTAPTCQLMQVLFMIMCCTILGYLHSRTFHCYRDLRARRRRQNCLRRTPPAAEAPPRSPRPLAEERRELYLLKVETRLSPYHEHDERDWENYWGIYRQRCRSEGWQPASKEQLARIGKISAAAHSATDEWVTALSPPPRPYGSSARKKGVRKAKSKKRQS